MLSLEHQCMASINGVPKIARRQSSSRSGFSGAPPSVALVFGIGMNASSTRDVEFTSGYRHVNSGYAATLHVL